MSLPSSEFLIRFLLYFSVEGSKNIRKQSSDATSSLFTVENEANYAILKLNNPPVNRLDTSLIRSLTAQFEKIEKDQNVNGVILTSVGV